MKKTAWALLPVTLSLFLASCADNVPSSSSPSEPPASSQTNPDDELDELSDINFDMSLTLNGFINDFSMGIPALAGKAHLLDFSFKEAATASAIVKTDRPHVATAEKKGDKWYVNGVKPGKTHLIIEDGDGVIHYRVVLTVAAPLDEEGAARRLYEVDHWKVAPGFEIFCGNFTTTFMDDLSATMAGVESGGVNLSGATFSVELDQTVLTGAEDPEYWYGFRVKDWKLTDFNLACVLLHKSGDWMHIKTNNALLGAMAPAEAK